MSSVETEAQSLLARSLTLGFEALEALVNGASEAIRTRFYELKKDSYFVPENHRSGKEHVSPSGKYRLVVEKYDTGSGTWNYSQGSVYDVATESLIAVVRRNYGSFPFVFIEGHSKGDFLVCGEHYMGQTVVDLATGEKHNTPKEGFGFCWSEPRYYAEAQLMVVSGCFWGSSYEFKFYDFSDPSNWYEIVFPKEYIDDDPQWPTIEGEGLIKVYQTVRIDDDESDEDFKVGEFASTRVLRREDRTFVLQEEWVSEEEKQLRLRNEEAQRRFDEEIRDYKATDPLFLEHLELVKDPELNPEEHFGLGVTYDNWCPENPSLKERRISRRIIRNKKWTVDLGWAQKTGPVKLTIYKDGKEHETKFFMEHSVESMREAVAYAKEVTRG